MLHKLVEFLGHQDGFSKSVWLKTKGVGTESQGFLFVVWIHVAAENDDGKVSKFLRGANEFEDFKAAYGGHYDIEQNQIRPTDRHRLRLLNKCSEVGDGFLS